MRRLFQEWLLEARRTFAELSPSEKFAKAWLWLLALSLGVVFSVIFGTLFYLSVLATKYFWGIWVVWIFGGVSVWASTKNTHK